MLNNYPPGAALDPSAPWNDSPAEARDDFYYEPMTQEELAQASRDFALYRQQLNRKKGQAA